MPGQLFHSLEALSSNEKHSFAEAREAMDESSEDEKENDDIDN